MTRLRTLLQTLACGSVVCLFQAPAAAQSERELEVVKRQLHELTNHANALINAGNLEEASASLNKARKLKAKLDAARKKRRGADDLHGLFNHLEAAVGALQKLGRKEEAKKLVGYARELRQSLQRGDRERGERGERRRERGERERGERGRERGERERGERERERGERRERGRERERGDRDERREGRGEHAQLEREIKIFGYAKSAYAEMGNERLVDMVERSMHARELWLEGARGDRAQKIIRAQPKWGQEVEVLNYASLALKKYKASEKAQATASLARQIQARNKKEGKEGNARARKERENRKRKEDEKKRDQAENKQHRRTEKRKLTEREAATQQLETALFCAKVLAEAKLGDGAHSLELWAQAMKLRLAGVRNEKAQAVFKKAPSREVTGKHFAIAAEILQDQGDMEHADFVGKMARSFMARRGRKERKEAEEVEREKEVRRKIR